jgi:hypothetical protein
LGAAPFGFKGAGFANEQREFATPLGAAPFGFKGAGFANEQGEFGPISSNPGSEFSNVQFLDTMLTLKLVFWSEFTVRIIR